jgi:pullulanase/glycogen debranching enzyme
MSGEEFNADYIPLPSHTPDLWGKGEQGKGRWLYASMIDWKQLKQQSKQDMLEDVTRMIAIRKADADLFRPVTSDKKPSLKTVALQTTGIDKDSIPVPYILYNERKAIVVCGNTTDITVKGVLNISLAGTPLENAKRLQITDLWNGGKAKHIKAEDLQKYPVVMKPDKTKRGGIAVLKIEF